MLFPAVLVGIVLFAGAVLWFRPRRLRSEAAVKEVSAFFDALKLYLDPPPTEDQLDAIKRRLDDAVHDFVVIAILSRPDPGALDRATRELVAGMQSLDCGLCIGTIRNVFFTFETRRQGKLPEAIWTSLPAMV